MKNFLEALKIQTETLHTNPVRAGLCTFPEEYKYSSASFYLNGDKRWDFISHYEG